MKLQNDLPTREEYIRMREEEYQANNKDIEALIDPGNSWELRKERTRQFETDYLMMLADHEARKERAAEQEAKINAEIEKLEQRKREIMSDCGFENSTIENELLDVLKTEEKRREKQARELIALMEKI